MLVLLNLLILIKYFVIFYFLSYAANNIKVHPRVQEFSDWMKRFIVTHFLNLSASH